jgi:hypothetical protein
MSLSFEYRRTTAKIKRLKEKVQTETNEYKKELYQIDLDEKIYHQANSELVAKDRMRELKMWSKLKKEFNDGSFDSKDVNKHQLDSYSKIMQNKVKTLTEGSSQPEVFNVVGQLETIKRVKKDGELENNKKQAISNKETFYQGPK